MRRKLLFLVLVAILAVAAYLYLQPPEPVLSADRVYNVTQTGETIPLNVTLSNVPSCSSWNMKVTWDPIYLRFAGVEEGPFLQSTNKSTFFVLKTLDYANGEMKVAAALTGEGDFVQGTGVICTINFTTVRVGTSTIEFASPANGTQAAIGDATGNHEVNHIEISGLISDQATPPVWASTGFQNTLIIGEVVVLCLASGIVYLRAHPRPPKLARRHEELQPKIDTEDQAESA